MQVNFGLCLIALKSCIPMTKVFPGSLTRKSSKVGNYRLGVRLVPFDHNTLVLEFQCRKCETCFETEIEADEHEGTRKSIQTYVVGSNHRLDPNEEVTCLHCSKLFSTSYVLVASFAIYKGAIFKTNRKIAMS